MRQLSSRHLSYRQTIVALMLNWYLPWTLSWIANLYAHRHMNPDQPIFLIMVSLAHIGILSLGNHMWTGSWICRKVD